MENWGAIFYVERSLENDPVLSTEADRQDVYGTIAHEMAHQWFGDLVTMQWWDEIWLNEGFATWLAYKATGQFHPEWQIQLDFIRSKEEAMMLDARQGTHPIVQPIRDVLQANQAFDSITYDKGAAVISMLERFVGEDAFRAGVQQYIRKHAYGNTVSDDLWAELDKTAPQPVSVIAHDFTLQAGVPLVTVIDKEHRVELQQTRFAVDPTGEQPTTWHVPVLERSVGAEGSWRGIVTREHPANIEKGRAGAVVVNASQAGYFRTHYPSGLLQPLMAHFSTLAPEDQIGLMDDTSALGYAGTEPLSDFLEVAGQVTPDTNAAVLRLVTDKLRDLDSRFDGLTGQARFRDYAGRVLNPIFRRVGWTADAGDSSDTTLLRASLLMTLSQLGDPRVISDARSRFAGLREVPKSFSAELRRSVLRVVAENADDATWNQLHEMAIHATSDLEKQELYALLGAARDPQLAQRALQLSLTDEVAVTTRPVLIRAVANSHFPDPAFEFASAHVDRVNEWLEPDSRNRFAARLLMRSGNAAMIPKLRAYAETHIPATARRDAIVAEAAVSYNARIRSQQLPEIDQWLKSSH
jgi:aminopeptidase N